MFRYNTKKQAFLIAALVILLCLACLTGATFALFTSDINDGTIGVVITSGDIEVDIVDTAGVTLQNRALDFITSSDDKVPLFEPGATFYTQAFQVKNTGNVSVKFRLSVSKDDRIDMTEFNEAFEVWIVRAEDGDYKNAERVTDFVGSLAVGDSSEKYCLVVKMKETMGNGFQGKTYTGIGVTVYAVQGNAELNTRES